MSPLGGFRETGSLPLFSPRRALFSPRRAHLLTTAKGRWYARGIVRSARQMRLLRKPPDNATALVSAAVIVCADGKTQPQTCLCGGLRFVTHLPPACANLPPAALPQIGRRLRRHPFLFAKKKQKARAQNDGVTVRYPIFERGRKECEFNAHPCLVASV